MSTIAMTITGAAAVGFLLVLLADWRLADRSRGEGAERLAPDPRPASGDIPRRAA